MHANLGTSKLSSREEWRVIKPYQESFLMYSFLSCWQKSREFKWRELSTDGLYVYIFYCSLHLVWFPAALLFMYQFIRRFTISLICLFNVACKWKTFFSFYLYLCSLSSTALLEFAIHTINSEYWGTSLLIVWGDQAEVGVGRGLPLTLPQGSNDESNTVRQMLVS